MATVLNDGRNVIRFNNSEGQTLLENWVEERQVQHLDEYVPEEGSPETLSTAQVHRHGHKGLLTTNLEAHPENVTTFRNSYTAPDKSGVRTVGKREQLLTQALYQKVSEDVHQEFNPPPPPVEYKSVTAKDFWDDSFVPSMPEPIKDHSVEREQPMTFWSQHKDKIHGVSQVKTMDTPFRKNAAFSTPIEEYKDQPKPYEQEQYPDM
ncbi:sperm-associated antigen 8-like [Branchiostoma floridae x Branchiostoma japonicum]